MNKILLIVFVCLLGNVQNVYAENRAGHKLYRGVVNVLTAPVEIPKQARAYWIEGAQKTDHILVWIGSGSVYGLVQGIKRAGSGVWDIMTFPFDVSDNDDPLLKPDYVFDEWPRNPRTGR
ncbi:MAG: exosortase system-associated protein, TIGR04073 family [Candidatus Omnitrophica bacterium]|nr:exosortase system-associated protein, TIGR04073 family [Candidatus Omnitrophota bacterium]